MTEETIERKNRIVMKLLHYFITEKNYSPIILQGIEDEIWLENLEEDYRIVRLVSSYVHNDEQMEFDVFKTKRILKKIKAKTLSFRMNVLSLYVDLGDNVHLDQFEVFDSVRVGEEEDLFQSELLKKSFPDLSQKLVYTEEGMQLFLKITSDINQHNKSDAKKAEDVFQPKVPTITYTLIAINVFIYFFGLLLGASDRILASFGMYAPAIQMGEYYRLFTAMFVHGGVFHLLFNCYALYVIGSQLEGFLGKAKYLVVYLFGGFMGALLSMVFQRNTLSIGASGAIFGLMGSLLYFGYHYRVYLGNVIKSQIVPLIILNLAIGFMMSGIDNFAHIGGLIGGTLMTITVGIKYKSTTFECVNGAIVTILFLAFLLYMAFCYPI